MGAPASTPGQIPNDTPGVDHVGSQNLPPPPRIYPPPHYCDYVKCIRLPESTSPSQNIPPFQQIYATLPEYILLPPRIYPPFQQLYATLPKSTPPSQNIGPTLLFNNSMRPSQNLPPPPPRIYPPFQQLYATLLDSTPPSQNVPHFQCQLYATLPQSTPPSQNNTPLFNNYMRPSQNLLIPPRIYPHFQQLQDYGTRPESAPPS